MRRNSSTPLLRAAADAPPAGKDGAPYDSIRPHLQTFDLVFFRGNWPFSKLIMAAEDLVDGIGAGQFSHVGLVVRGDAFPPTSPYYTAPGAGNAVYVFESQNSADDGVANVHGTTMFGVQLRNLDLVVAAYDRFPDTKLAWARMLKTRRPSMDGWPVVFARYDGHLYDSWLDLAADTFCCLRPLRWLVRSCCCCCPCADNRNERQICSEIVANTLRDLGALPPGVNPENVIPSDFLEKPGGGATFDSDGEIPVLFEPAVVFTMYPKPGAAYDAESCNCGQ